MRKFFKEFKAFISKGNVFDLAVGMIIATAFNKIVSSLVNDIIMPLVTWATGASDLSALSVVLRTTIKENGDIVKLTWKYGNFLQTVIDFLIIAFSVFLMVKVVTSSRKKFKEFGDSLEYLTKKEVKEDKKKAKQIAKAEGRNKKEVYKELQLERVKVAEEEAKKKEEEKKAKEEEDRKTILLKPTY